MSVPWGMRKVGEPRAVVVSTTPDVCLTPCGDHAHPVAYDIAGLCEQTIRVAETVTFTGHPAMTMNSRVPTVRGDEPGSAGGVKSGVHRGYCRPVTHSGTVTAEGHFVIRHDSDFWMNCPGPEGPGNTMGRAVYRASGPGPSPRDDAAYEALFEAAAFDEAGVVPDAALPADSTAVLAEMPAESFSDYLRAQVADTSNSYYWRSYSAFVGYTVGIADGIQSTVTGTGTLVGEGAAATVLTATDDAFRDRAVAGAVAAATGLADDSVHVAGQIISDPAHAASVGGAMVWSGVDGVLTAIENDPVSAASTLGFSVLTAGGGAIQVTASAGRTASATVLESLKDNLVRKSPAPPRHQPLFRLPNAQISDALTEKLEGLRRLELRFATRARVLNRIEEELRSGQARLAAIKGELAVQGTPIERVRELEAERKKLMEDGQKKLALRDRAKADQAKDKEAILKARGEAEDGLRLELAGNLGLVRRRELIEEQVRKTKTGDALLALRKKATVPPPSFAEGLTDARGSYNAARDRIMLANMDPWEAAATYSHEYWHSYQAKILSLPQAPIDRVYKEVDAMLVGRAILREQLAAGPIELSGTSMYHELLAMPDSKLEKLVLQQYLVKYGVVEKGAMIDPGAFEPPAWYLDPANRASTHLPSLLDHEIK